MAGITGTVPPHIAHLNDIGDVNVPAPVDGFFVYWDAAAGRWQCQAVIIAVDHLNDIGDVNVPAPGDQFFLYWDVAAGRWQCRILIDADIPATIARDAEVAADIAAHAALPTVHQDAPALIAVHTAIPAAHHAKTGDDEVYGLFRTGLAANIPVVGIAGRFYWTTDTHILYYDTGAAWVETTRGETVTRLAQLAERAHGSLTGVTADQHHDQAHAASHENGGGDEVSVLGLSGLLADGQTPLAHKDTHDPEDGADPLDTAVPVKVGAANAEGTSHSLARADHVHEREHAIYTHPAGIQCTLVEADIPATIARDAEVATAVSDHAALTTGVHGVGANYLAYTKGSQKEALFHNDYMARAYLSANQNDIVDSTHTKVLLNAETYDPGGNFDAANSKYIVPVDGYYFILGSLLWVNTSVVADRFYQIEIWVNAATKTVYSNHSSIVDYILVTVSDIIHLAANDEIELYCYHKAGVNTVDVYGHEYRTFMVVNLVQAD